MMSKCKDSGRCGLGGYCDNCYQVVIAEKDEQIKQLQDEIAELKNKPADPWMGVLNEEGEL